MKFWIPFLLTLFILFSGEQVWAQRTGPGLFMGPGMCSDVSGQVTSQTYCLDYSSGGLLVWNGSQWVPLSGNLTQSLNTAVGLVVTNTNAGATAQSLVQVNNGSGYFGGLGVLGTGWATSGPYHANEAYLNSGGDLLIYAGGATIDNLHFAAAGQGAAGTLDMGEDGAGNFALSTSNTAAFLEVFGGNPAFQVISTTNLNSDIFEVWAQNLTQGIGTSWNYIRQVGSCATCGFDLSGKGGGGISINAANTSGGTVVYGSFSVNSGSGGSTQIASPLTLSGSTSVQGTMTLEAPLIMDHNQHLRFTVGGGLPPTLGACGPSSTFIAGSTDTAGGVQIAGGGTSSCVVNFGTAYANYPFCDCSVHGNTGGALEACSANVTTLSSITMIFGVVTGTYVTWHCLGN